MILERYAVIFPELEAGMWKPSEIGLSATSGRRE
jgi:hypothetical protein